MEIAYPTLNPSPLHGEGNKKSPLSKNWRGAGGEVITLVVRPRLHCPEIDEYDEISLKQVIRSTEGKNELEIGDKIVYRV